MGWKSGILTTASPGDLQEQEAERDHKQRNIKLLSTPGMHNYQSQYKTTPEAEMIPTTSD